ncbi:extracellular serine/threonine protein kinase four-jointed [Helicoverpa zea]|uniref:extracellular serine/threonine protein kinase four-jointed n=1 Tax=Helicoverpa zea TaxID=7113 RepID=UPI001F5A5E40|nr:extracellular serine/threonine protein kinase four-jointed [Helicoverpa zea]
MDKTKEEFNPTQSFNERIPTLKDINVKEKINTMSTIDFRNRPYVIYNDFSTKKNYRKEVTYCFLSVILSFIFGLAIGIVVMSGQYEGKILVKDRSIPRDISTVKPEIKTEKNKFLAVSFTGQENKYNKDIYPKGLTEVMKDILKDTKSDRHAIVLNKTFIPDGATVLYDNVYWGPQIEDAMPQGYGDSSSEIWEKYIDDAEVVKMEPGCGRMQNRLVTFKDGVQACVRYRQNTDQIQGEIFSFYVGRLLNLTNLAPSVIRIVDLKDRLWKNVANDIASAQWSSNRAVVLTQYIPSLESASIPDIFRPTNRHLNKLDILKMSLRENDTDISKQLLLDKLRVKELKLKQEQQNFSHIDLKLNKKTVDRFLELAQWSDLIIFDYLTANLDRIVNNLFNYQWNVNIMDGPAHNLAKKMDSGLLIFLDNESGLLHGYRLLKKYNVYHSLMLDNLCVFRKRTIDSMKKLYSLKSIGSLLSDMFHKKNSVIIRDILPSLPEKNSKILIERIGKVLNQVEKCEMSFR